MDNYMKNTFVQVVTFNFCTHFLEYLKTPWDINSIRESAERWSFPHFISKHANVALSHWVTADNKNGHQQNEKPTTYYEKG